MYKKGDVVYLKSIPFESNGQRLDRVVKAVVWRDYPKTEEMYVYVRDPFAILDKLGMVREEIPANSGYWAVAYSDVVKPVPHHFWGENS